MVTAETGLSLQSLNQEQDSVVVSHLGVGQGVPTTKIRHTGSENWIKDLRALPTLSDPNPIHQKRPNAAVFDATDQNFVGHRRPSTYSWIR